MFLCSISSIFEKFGLAQVSLSITDFLMLSDMSIDFETKLSSFGAGTLLNLPQELSEEVAAFLSGKEILTSMVFVSRYFFKLKSLQALPSCSFLDQLVVCVLSTERGSVATTMRADVQS